MSINWQREFKYECHMQLAFVSDQCNQSYIALQNVVEAMKQLCKEEEKSNPMMEALNNKANITSASQRRAQKQPPLNIPPKKGIYQIFDSVSKAHLNSRLWLKTRQTLVKFMLNQLIDAGKVKGRLN